MANNSNKRIEAFEISFSNGEVYIITASAIVQIYERLNGKNPNKPFKTFMLDNTFLLDYVNKITWEDLQYNYLRKELQPIDLYAEYPKASKTAIYCELEQPVKQPKPKVSKMTAVKPVLSPDNKVKVSEQVKK